MRVTTHLLSAMATRAALHISNFPKPTISSPLYTSTSFHLSTRASKHAARPFLLYPPKKKSQNRDPNERELTSPGYENILELSEDEKPVADMDTWKLAESAIIQEIRPITLFARMILHSNRYKDGELLSLTDEKKIVEKLLPYHPRLKDKIGRGFDSIMVGRHPEFKCSRCLFVIQKDGHYTDFSHKKCLEGFIRKTYPSFAEKFISIHFRRNCS